MSIKAIIKVQDRGNLKAYADVLLDKKVMIKGISLVDGKNGLFINMPQRLGADGKYYDQVYPVTPESREELTKAVVDEYQHQISKTQTLESDKESKKQAKQAAGQEQQEETAAEPKASRGRKPKEPEPEPEEDQGMAMEM